MGKVPALKISTGPPVELAIATLTNAPADTINHFIDDHLKLGVAKIVVYLDDPSSLNIHDIRQENRIDIISCDDEFWKSRGFKEKPSYVEFRQMEVFNEYYLKSEHPWLGLCDIDERFVPKTSFQDLFASIDDSIQELKATSWEAAWPTFADDVSDFSATYCRRPILSEDRLKWIERQKPLFFSLSDKGIVGHPYGKVILRTGIRNIKMRIHGAVKISGKSESLLKRKKNALHLLHYDAIGLHSWAKKFKSRLGPTAQMGGQAPHRKAITDLVSLSDDMDFREGIFRELYGISDDHILWLLEKGAIRRIVRN